MPDGKLIIGTELETKKVDIQIKDLEKRLNDLKADIDTSGLKEDSHDLLVLQKEAEKLQNQLISLYEKREKLTQQQIPKEFIPDVNTIGENQEVQKLVKEINSLKYAYDNINKQTIWTDDDVDKLDKLESKIKETIKQLEELTGKKWQIEGFEENTENAKKMSNKISEGMDKGIKSLKRFALSLFSVGSIFAVVSKASSSYLQHDEELAKKMSDTWAGLGAILSPIINGIANILLKGVAIINQFIYALTGVDLVAKANEKALKKQTSAQKALNKETAKFDEITTLGTLDKASSTSSSLDNQIDLPTLSEGTIDTINKIAEALKPVYNVIKDIIEWCLDNPDIVLTMLGIGALVTGISKVIGISTGTAGAAALGGTGLAGLLGILLAIAAIGVITISIVKVVKEINELNESVDNAKNSIEDGTKATDKYIAQSDKVIKGKKKEDKTVKDVAKSYSALSGSMTGSSKAAQETYQEIYKEQLKYGIAGNLLYAGSFEVQKKAMNDNIENSYKYLTQLGKMYDANQLGEEGINDYASAMYDFMDYVGKGGISIDNLTKRFGLNKEQAEALQQMYYKVRLNLEKIPETKKVEILTNLGLADTSTFSGKVRKAVDDSMIKALTNAQKTINEWRNKFTGDSWVDRIMRTTLGKVKLAQGGIVNNPGKGVPIGTNIIAGEAGREAVLPLNDQVLSQLGQQIGKYITINATMVNNMNGRQISRELQRIQSNNDFTSNR